MRLTSLGQVPLEKWQFVFSEKDHLRGVGSVSPGTSCWGMSLSIQEVVGLGGSHSWRQRVLEALGLFALAECLQNRRLFSIGNKF